jgi:asparagine N-glycosylation enzyme membrane subunit Stt3
VSFPFGATPVWPPFLDWLIAAAVGVAAPADTLAVERAIVWIPAVLGAATVAAAGALGWRHFSPLAGLVAGLLLALLPAHHVHSQLGQVDHQVVLGLAAVALLACAMSWLRGSASHGWAALVGLVSAASLLVSPGALLQILPVQGVALAWLLAAPGREEAALRTRSVALAHAVVALFVLPACLASGPFPGIGAFSPLVLSGFQPLWFGAGALGLLCLAELFRRSAAFASRPSRIGSALALAGAGSAAALALLPGLVGTLARAGGWFSHEDAFLSTVAETQPLLFPAGRFEPGFALRSLTPGLLAFPFAWLWLVSRRGLDPNRRPASALLLAWSLVFFALALAQERFANAFAPGLALTLGAAAEELQGIVGRHARPARLAFGAALAALVTATLAPAALDYGRLFTYSRFVFGKANAPIPVDSRRKVVVEDAARFLREASPPTQGFLDATLVPEYGVLTSWDDGHLVRYRAERPTVQDNFGSYADRRAYDLARGYFDAADEEEAYRIAQELGARYTVATREGSGQTFGPSPHSLGQRLWRRLGNGVAEASGRASPALGRHRLIWLADLSGRARDVQSPARDRVALFEIVPGAWVTGAARPGERVRFELPLRAGAGQVWYRAHAEASADGRYQLRLPYPTDLPVSREVRAAGVYRVKAGGRSAAFELRETDVRAGATLSGPDLQEDDA